MLGFPDLPKTDATTESKHQEIQRVATGRTPRKAARKSIVHVLDAKEVERKQLEKENENWEKNIVCKAVPMPARWTGKMRTGKKLP